MPGPPDEPDAEQASTAAPKPEETASSRGSEKARLRRVSGRTQERRDSNGRGALINGGARGDRTPGLMTASHALSQLSYGPNLWAARRQSM
jgi:hypothetical protein